MSRRRAAPKDERAMSPPSRCRASGWPSRSRLCATNPTHAGQEPAARPKVFLANLGKLSEFTARATFAKNFYEAGGIEALEQ